MEDLREIFDNNKITSIFRKRDLNVSIEKKEILERMLEKAEIEKNIIKVKDDIYILGKYWRKELVSDEILAQLFVENSYSSMEFVLSQIAWIPEAVYVGMSVMTTGEGKKSYNTPLKNFNYYYIKEKKYEAGVSCSEEGRYKYYKAKPLKALVDIIYRRKENWVTLEPLHESYRIEYEDLETLKKEDFDELQGTYGVVNVENFLEGIRKELRL